MQSKQVTSFITSGACSNSSLTQSLPLLLPMSECEKGNNTQFWVSRKALEKSVSCPHGTLKRRPGVNGLVFINSYSLRILQLAWHFSQGREVAQSPGSLRERGP